VTSPSALTAFLYIMPWSLGAVNRQQDVSKGFRRSANRSVK
jgi:hypothetical protein